METLAVSGIGKRNGLLELLRPLAAERGLSILGLDADEFPPARVTVDHFARVPGAKELDFVDQYARALHNFNAVGHLTLIDPEIPVLGAIRDVRSRYLNPTSDSSILCEDKYVFHQFLDQVGIPSVPTYLSPPTKLPFIVKDRRGSAASGFRVYKNETDMDNFDLLSRDGNSVYQPYVGGEHLCVDALFALEEGYLVDLCVKKVIDKKNGESFLVESVAPGPISELVKDLSRHIPFRGIVNLDIYQMSHADDLLVMEVNCRIGGNYPASHLFGCDMISKLLLELQTGRSPSRYKHPNYQVGMRVGKYYGFTRPF